MEKGKRYLICKTGNGIKLDNGLVAVEINDKDELIELLKDNMRLDVSYEHDNYVELQLIICDEIIDSVSIATGLGGE